MADSIKDERNRLQQQFTELKASHIQLNSQLVETVAEVTKLATQLHTTQLTDDLASQEIARLKTELVETQNQQDPRHDGLTITITYSLLASEKNSRKKVNVIDQSIAPR
jgi:septal ring factor EnvC (AmiA/AmiB activator)